MNLAWYFSVCHTCLVHTCRDASEHHFRITKWQHVRENKFILTFLWTAVLLARAEVLEAIQIALAATVTKGLTLHGGHVEEVAMKQTTAGSLVFRKPADLGNLWGEDLSMGLDQVAYYGLHAAFARLHEDHRMP